MRVIKAYHLKRSILILTTILSLVGLWACEEASHLANSDNDVSPSDELAHGDIMVDSTGGLLTLAQDDQNRFSGLYERDDLGIRFVASLKNDDITTLSITTREGTAMFETNADENNIDLTIAGAFLQRAKRADIVQFKTALRASEEDALDDLEVDSIGDEAAVDSLKDYPEYALLPWLSYALGEFGYNGRDYPIVFPIHGVAMMAGQTLGIVLPSLPDPLDEKRVSSESDEADASKMTLRAGVYCRAIKKSCRYGNCPSDNGKCTGMCGPKCTCWESICGDCCAYSGCYYHDQHCGSNYVVCTLNFWQFFNGSCSRKYGLQPVSDIHLG